MLPKKFREVCEEAFDGRYEVPHQNSDNHLCSYLTTAGQDICDCGADRDNLPLNKLKEILPYLTLLWEAMINAKDGDDPTVVSVRDIEVCLMHLKRIKAK